MKNIITTAILVLAAIAANAQSYSHTGHITFIPNDVQSTTIRFTGTLPNGETHTADCFGHAGCMLDAPAGHYELVLENGRHISFAKLTGIGSPNDPIGDAIRAKVSEFKYRVDAKWSTPEHKQAVPLVCVALATPDSPNSLYLSDAEILHVPAGLETCYGAL